MEIYGDIAQYLELLLNVAFAVLPTLAVVAVVHPLGRWAADGFVRLWGWSRQYFDDPTDEAIKLLAEKSGKTPEQVIEELTRRIDKVASILQEAIPQGG